jgi:hypothetical protein
MLFRNCPLDYRTLRGGSELDDRTILFKWVCKQIQVNVPRLPLDE